jgi:hypothetical protein
LEEPRETTVSVKGTCVRDEIKEHGDFWIRICLVIYAPSSLWSKLSGWYLSGYEPRPALNPSWAETCSRNITES